MLIKLVLFVLFLGFAHCKVLRIEFLGQNCKHDVDGWFVCNSGYCLAPEFVCDGEKHCWENEDEDPSYCAKRTKKQQTLNLVERSGLLENKWNETNSIENSENTTVPNLKVETTKGSSSRHTTTFSTKSKGTTMVEVSSPSTKAPSSPPTKGSIWRDISPKNCGTLATYNTEIEGSNVRVDIVPWTVC